MRRRATTVFVVALAAMLAPPPTGEAAELQRAVVLRDGDAVVRLPGIAMPAAAVRVRSRDGTVDIAIPGADRETLWFETFAGGVFTEIESVRYDRQIVTAVWPTILVSTGAVYAVCGLADRTLVAGRTAGRR